MIKSLKYIPYLLKQYYHISQFEKWNKEKIEKYQINAFQKIFERAKQIPFYKELYEEAGVLDAKINSLEDIKKLPLIDKTLCRKNGYEEYFLKKELAGTIVNNSTGSTGKPFQLKIPAKTEMLQPIKVIHAMRQFGWTPFSKGLEIWRETSSTHKGLMRSLGLLKSISIFKPLPDIKNFIDREKPDYLFSYRNFYSTLADYFKEQGFNYSPKFILSTAEEVNKGQRLFLEKFFHTKLLNVYGAIEAPTIAYSCPKHNNFHVFQTTVIVEIENIRQINGHEYGEIIVTNLSNDVMPFIRYKTGDLARISKNNCPCGKQSQIFYDVIGRSDDGIKLNDGRVLNYQHLSGVFRDLEMIDQYKAVYSKNRDLVEFLFKLKNKDKTDETKVAIAKLLEKNFNRFNYKYRFVDSFEVSEIGKFKVFEVVD